MITYKGTFTSRDNLKYDVIIETESDETKEIELKLGVPPFTVKYEGTSDFNKPLKLSNATIKILTTETPWDLVTQKANDVKVSLYQYSGLSQRVIWCGFIDPKIYTMGADKNLEEFDINCIDLLSSLEYKYYGKGNEDAIVSPQVKTFYDIIKTALSELSISHIYFPKIYNKDGVTLGLKDFLVNEKTFIDKDCFSINADGSQSFQYDKNDNYKEVLEKLMMYLNLTMIQYRNYVYCLPMDYVEKYNFVSYNLSTDREVNVIVRDTKTLTKLYQPTSYSLTDQYNQVTVTAKMQEYDSLIPDLFDDKYLLNTTNGVYKWNEEIKETVSDNQKGDKEVKDDCTWRFFKHRYYGTYYYEGDVPLMTKNEMHTLDELKTLTCGQILKYNCALSSDHSQSGISYYNKDKYKDYSKEGGLTNYVYLGTYDKNNGENTPLIGTSNMPQVFVFDKSYLNLNYKIIFRPPNGTPWHLPSSWEQYEEDEFAKHEAYIEMEISCAVGGKTYYYDNRDNVDILIVRSTWKPIGVWKEWDQAEEEFAPRCRIPFQCLDNTDHLFGKEWKNLITSGIAGNEGTDNGFIIKPPTEAIGKMARFNFKIFWRRMKSNESDHNTRATWLKELSVKMQIPKDESIKNWKADSEYSAVISDAYVNEGEKIEMKVNTYDYRIPSYSCVMVKDGDNYSLADKFTIVGNTEQPHRMEEWKIYHKVCQHTTPRKILTTTIEGTVNPYSVCNHQGDSYIVNEWETDYYDNKTNLELIEKWNLIT